jgi:ATP/maltotriose-dependent transcriptional regulator MalT
MFLGRPLEVLEHAAAAERAYALQSLSGGHGDYFYMFAVHTVRMGALVALARYAVVREELNDFLARAQATDNRTAILQASLIRTFTERTVDNCKNSRARLDAERSQLPESFSFSVLRLTHMIATMQVACATGDYAWARAALAEDWPAYLRAPVHGTAYLACIAHSYHARILLNQHVASGATGDISRMLRPDLRALARLPATALRDGMVLRVRARCAYLNGDTPRAIELLRHSAKMYKDAMYLDEAERDHLALAYLIGGAEKPGLCAAAIAALRERGVCDPVEELRGYYPEVLRDAG